jgi:hypothetical protein
LAAHNHAEGFMAGNGLLERSGKPGSTSSSPPISAINYFPVQK